MCKMLLSINPKYVEKIFDGSKRFEFRKVRCKDSVDSILIYATSPTMKIVGEAKIKQVIEGVPEDIWKRTKYGSGITKSFFDIYFKNRKNAVAYELIEVKKYSIPQNLNMYGISQPPQSFRYIYG